MKKRAISIVLAVLLSVSLFIVPANAAGVSGATTTAALNMRSGAGTDYSKIMTMPKGAEVIVQSTSNGWSKIVYNNTVGYASAQYLSSTSEVSGSFGTGTISGSDVRMRSGAGTSYSIIGTYDKGTQMKITGASGNWYAVSYGGKTGYVSADYMTLSAGAPSADTSKPAPAPSPTPTPAPAPVTGGFKGAVIGTGVRMRSQPNTNSSVLGYYSNGVTMTVLGSVDGWYKASYNGKTGYVSASYMRISPDNVYSAAKNGSVNGSAVRMRMGPSTDFAVIGSYNKGTEVKISGEYAGWYEVSVSGKYGYIKKDYVKVGSAAVSEPEKTMDSVGTITGNSVRMRSGPGTSYSVIGYYNKGIQVNVTGQTGSWYAVTYKGLKGYISADYVKLGTSNALADQIVATAKEYLGTPYVWGGTSPKGFDCSGFVYYVYQQYGYQLQRRASLQYANNGVSVSKNQLQPGDLVFFSDSVDPIGHVGMYIGNGYFIHASSGKGCVCITALEGSSYYINHYAGAKRII